MMVHQISGYLVPFICSVLSPSGVVKFIYEPVYLCPMENRQDLCQIRHLTNLTCSVLCPPGGPYLPWQKLMWPLDHTEPQRLPNASHEGHFMYFLVSWPFVLQSQGWSPRMAVSESSRPLRILEGCRHNQKRDCVFKDKGQLLRCNLSWDLFPRELQWTSSRGYW